LIDSLGFAASFGTRSATEQSPPAPPYAAFLRSDWARNGINAKLREMSSARKKEHYEQVAAMAPCWPVPPTELLWVGGTYALHPKQFPAQQQEHAWVYEKLRPLGIQPDSFLASLHQAGYPRLAPTEVWPTMSPFPGVLPDSVRAGKLWTYLETHKLHESIWYGQALRNKHKHYTSILLHPLPDQWIWECKASIPQRRVLHLPTAPSVEEMRRREATCAASNVKIAATELAFASECMDADIDSDTSGLIDYGTLAYHCFRACNF
jgi:hypothetical protein